MPAVLYKVPYAAPLICGGRQQRQGEGRAAEAFLAGFVRMGF